MKETLLLAERYSALCYEELTSNALRKAKECILDYLGCTYAGLSFESTQVIREFALGTYRQGDCTVVGRKERLVPPGACLINSTTGHAPELDDTSNEGGVHAGVVLIPVALALAETLGASGKDLLTGIVVGYDVDIKVGKAANPEGLFQRGFHPTALCGMFGAAMTAAHLMKLNSTQTANALGIAGSYVAGNLECYSDGSLTKRLHPGIASSSGVAAAALASKGYTGPKSILEGPRGFFKTYCVNPRPDELKESDVFEIEKIGLKPHACCRFNQPSIDAVLDICSRNRIDPKQIATMEVELLKSAYDIVGQPAEIKFNPKNVVDAQFSVPFGVAIACIEGKAFLDQYTETTIQRQDVRELMKRITVKHAPDLDPFFPESIPSRVKITTGDGKSFVKEVRYAKGEFQNPLSWEEILQKFNALVPSSLLGEKRRKQLIETIQNLEEVEDIKELTALLGGGSE